MLSTYHLTHLVLILDDRFGNIFIFHALDTRFFHFIRKIFKLLTLVNSLSIPVISNYKHLRKSAILRLRPINNSKICVTNQLIHDMFCDNY